MREPHWPGQVLYRRRAPQRARQFQIETVIVAGADGRRRVIKRALHAEGLEHLRRMAANHAALLPARGAVITCPCAMQGDLLEMEHVEGMTLGQQLIEALRADDRATLETLLHSYRQCVTALDTHAVQLIGPGSRAAIFAGHDPDTTDLVTSGNIDQGFDHLIDQEGRLVLIDYEWMLGFPVPTHFVLYRAAQLFFQEVPRQISPRFRLQDMCDFYGITQAERLIYDRMEYHFQCFVRGVPGTP